MSDVLQRICDDKRRFVEARKAALPLAELKRRLDGLPPTRGFAAALRRCVAAGGWGLIAEIKKASPSKGLIRADFDPPGLARAYREGGATCLSVLTDEPYFQGRDTDLQAARAAVDLPIIRKDFMIDPYQVYEARAIGADCILLIMAALTDAQATSLASLAKELGLDVLVEVHDRAELDRALHLDCELLGINNRNLKTLSVDLQTTIELARHVPPGRLLVSESGLDGPADLARMAEAGARCFLIGESFMRQPDVAAAVRRMLTPPAAA